MESLKERLNLGYLGYRLKEDWPSLLLLTLLLGLSTGAIAVSNWVDGLWVLPVIAILGLLLGYFLAISVFTELVAILMAIIYGVFVVWVMLADSFLPAEIALGDRMGEVWRRSAVWLEGAVEGGYNRDTMMFVLALAMIVWMLGFNAAANMFRSRRLWYALIPPGLALLINTYYYAGDARMDFLLIGYLFLAFTLAVRTNAVMREHMWQLKRVGYQPGTRWDLVRAGTVAGILVIGLAWSAPAASASSSLADAWDQSVNPWHRLQDTFQRLFGGVKGGTAVTADYYGGASLNMGGPIRLSDETVMYVYAPDDYHYYWRSRVFDTYDDGEWTTTSEGRKTSDFGLLGSEMDIEYVSRRTVVQRYQLLMRVTRLVYAAGQPESFTSLPISFDVDYTDPDEPDYVSVKLVRSQEILEAGAAYQATSSVSIADEQSLRAATTDYPVWVTDKYLEIPEDITLRTRELAVDITRDYDNTYDKARAIEQWLRENIEYNQQILPVPNGKESVDYFLFESKEGYCTYYAGSMVVMLRSLGIPSRVAVGFAQGTRDDDLGAYRVAESDAHAWVETYFPGYGWIEFEPTSAIDPITRAEAPIDPVTGEPIDPAQRDLPEEFLPEATPIGGASQVPELPEAEPKSIWEQIQDFRVPTWIWFILVGIVVAFMGLTVAWFLIEQRGLQGMSEVSRSYARLNIYAPLMGVKLPDSATPFERANTLSENVPQDSEVHVQRITRLYVEEQYTPKFGVNGHEDNRANLMANNSWRFLRPAMLRSMLVRWFNRVNPLRRLMKDITIR